MVYEPGDSVLSMIKYKSMCMESEKAIWKKQMISKLLIIAMDGDSSLVYLVMY